MELNRRSFLRGLLTVAAAVIVPIDALSADLPRVVGDGIHDDAAGLQAALDGKPFVCEGMVVRDADDVFIRHGRFRITATLRAPKNTRLVMIGSHVKSEAPNGIALDLTADPQGAIANNYFEGGTVMFPARMLQTRHSENFIEVD